MKVTVLQKFNIADRGTIAVIQFPENSSPQNGETYITQDGEKIIVTGQVIRTTPPERLYEDIAKGIYSCLIKMVRSAE